MSVVGRRAAKADHDTRQESLAKNWEPKDHERLWYRSQQNGDLGYLCRVGGVDHIRLNRPNQPDTHTLRKFNAGAGWIKETEHRPFTAFQLSEVAFAADAVLCRLVGLRELGARQWIGMKDEERIAWSENGPPSGVERKKCYDAIMGALREFTK